MAISKQHTLKNFSMAYTVVHLSSPFGVCFVIQHREDIIRTRSKSKCEIPI